MLIVAGKGSGGYVTVAFWQLLAHTCVGVQTACALLLIVKAAGVVYAFVPFL